MNKYTKKIFGFSFSSAKNNEDQTNNKGEDVNQQLISQLNKNKFPTWQQLKKLPKILNKQERLRISIVSIILILSVIGLGYNWFIEHSAISPTHGNSYSEGLLGSPNFINPILATTDADRDLVRLIFSGLVKFDEQGNLVNDLAAGYTIDAEQKVYTFELRDDIYWHDGEKVLADDIIFTISRIKNPEYKSPLINSFNGVSVNKISDQVVQFTLEKPFTPFLSILTVGILPEHLWYSIPDFGANLAELNKKPVGSGPYQFQSLTKDASGVIKNYTLSAYDKYHLGQPYIKELVLKFYPDFDTAVSALQNKNVDGLIYLPKEYKAQIKNKDVVFKNLRLPQYTAVFFNPNNNEVLNNLSFRKVLAMATNKQRILTEALNGDGQIINSPILPGLLGYDPEIKGIDYDLAASASALDELGWLIPDEGGWRIKDEKELTLKLTTIDQAENVKVISIIKEDWENIGIKTELEIIPKDKIKSDVLETRNYQILVFGEIININSGPYPFWHSSQNKYPGLNLSVMGNKDIDEYLDNIRNAKNDDAKLEPLKKFQEKLLEQQFAIFLYNPTYTYPVGQQLKGLDNLNFINLPADRFSNINSWFIKTKRKLSN